MSDTSSIAGQVPPFPVVIDNPPGQTIIAYRVGDYAAFHDALLQGHPGEQQLKGWRPTEGDLGLQLLEWWAYLADVLTFYNQVIANQSYLGTAVLPPPAAPAPAGGAPGAAAAGAAAPPADPTNAQKIARVVGYRAKPGIAATGVLGVLVNALRPITVPAGFAVQSKPGPGQQPQVFEADPSQTQYLPTTTGGAVRIDLHVPTTVGDGTSTGLLLPGIISSVKASDMAVIALDPSHAAAASAGSAISTAGVVQSVAAENDPRGKPNTRIKFAPLTIPSGLAATDVENVQVLRSTQSVTVYGYVAQAGGAPIAIAPSGTGVAIHLSQIARAITVGDIVVLEIPPAAPPGQPTYVTAVVDQYEEMIWYANADTANTPNTPPTQPTNVVPVSVPHTVLTLGSLSATSVLSTARVWYAYHPVGTPMDEFAKSPILANAVGSLSPPPATPSSQANEIVLVDSPAPTFVNGDTVLLEGADGIGAVATLTADTKDGTIALQSTDGTTSLVLPLRVLFNVMHVTAGKTVAGEVLGNGDSTVAGQSFTLQKSPLTYVAGKDPGFPQSTLQVFVDGTQWTEVASFSGQPPEAKVFITQESPSHVTTVLFGDGVNGARLPTGTGNVTATYRYGSGPGDPALGGPAVGSLVTVLSPQPGLQAVRNPVPMTGGAAPTSAQQMQATAPAATLTFGRAVSSSDFEAIASQAPQVSRVRTVFGWDPASRRALSKVYVAGGADAVAGVSHALAQASDANVPVRVIAANEIDVSLSSSVVYDPSHDPGDVASAVTNALTDRSQGPFSPAQLRIGDPLRTSAISAACLGVPGVIAIRNLQAQNVTDPDPKKHAPLSLPADPGEGGFFALTSGDVQLTMEAGDG